MDIDAGTERERLDAYAPGEFDEDLLTLAAATAEELSYVSDWRSYSTTRAVPEPFVFHPRHGKPAQVVDSIPYDWDRGAPVMVHRGPLGSGLNPNMLMRFSVVAKMLPDFRHIGIGNPTRVGNPYGELRFEDLWSTFNGDLSRIAMTGVNYLEAKGVSEAVTHAGDSLGGSLAVISAKLGTGTIDTQRIIDKTPADIVPRNPLKVILTGLRTTRRLKHYRDAAASLVYEDAVLASDENGWQFQLGNAKASNFVLLMALSKGLFRQNARDALRVNPGADLVVVQGSEDEHAPSEALRRPLMGNLQKEFPSRVFDIILKGQHHLMLDDIVLNGLLTAQATRINKKSQA